MISYIRNILAYPSALIYVFRNGLVRYFLLSGLISLVIGGFLFFGVCFLSDDIGSIFMQFYPLDFAKGFLTKYIGWITGAILSVVSLLIYKYLLLILIAPFMSGLSEKVETIETGYTPEKQGLGQVGYGIIRGVRISIRNIMKEIFYTLIVLLLGLIPIFSPFSVVGIFLIQAYFLGFANTDYHLEKSLSIKESVRYCKSNKWALMGNGTGFILLLFIPVIGLIVAPVLGTVVATREALRAS